MKASGVRRNVESSRDRYVTDQEYNVVYAAAPKPVRLMMELTYRTLQRPESDIIGWTPANIRTKGSEKVLHVKQNKTGQVLDIALTGRLLDLIESVVGDVPILRRPLVHTLKGKPYTYSGLDSMLRRAQTRARQTLPTLEPFGFRDLKGKGATDMWLAGEPIERIQALCGHKSKTTTEIYVKSRWRSPVASNAVQIGA